MDKSEVKCIRRHSQIINGSLPLSQKKKEYGGCILRVLTYGADTSRPTKRVLLKLYHHRGTNEIIIIAASLRTAPAGAASSSSHCHLENRSTMASPRRLGPWSSCFIGRRNQGRHPYAIRSHPTFGLSQGGLLDADDGRWCHQRPTDAMGRQDNQTTPPTIFFLLGLEGYAAKGEGNAAAHRAVKKTTFDA